MTSASCWTRPRGPASTAPPYQRLDGLAGSKLAPQHALERGFEVSVGLRGVPALGQALVQQGLEFLAHARPLPPPALAAGLQMLAVPDDRGVDRRDALAGGGHRALDRDRPSGRGGLGRQRRSRRRAVVGVLGVIGLRQTPEMIAEAALQEDVDAVGLSVLSGAHMELVPRLLDLLRVQGQSDLPVFVGGIVPDEDIAALTRLGVRGVFGPGTHTQAVIEAVREAAGAARGG